MRRGRSRSRRCYPCKSASNVTARRALRGQESTVTIHGDKVVKRLTNRGVTANREYNRTPELTWYQQRPVPMMPRLIRGDETELWLEYAGEPLDESSRYVGLAAWVEATRAALTSAGVYHRDIHTGNVLHLDGRFALIDWTWATTDPTAPFRRRQFSDDAALSLIAALDAAK